MRSGMHTDHTMQLFMIRLWSFNSWSVYILYRGHIACALHVWRRKVLCRGQYYGGNIVLCEATGYIVRPWFASWLGLGAGSGFGYEQHRHRLSIDFRHIYIQGQIFYPLTSQWQIHVPAPQHVHQTRVNSKQARAISISRSIAWSWNIIISFRL